MDNDGPIGEWGGVSPFQLTSIVVVGSVAG